MLRDRDTSSLKRLLFLSAHAAIQACSLKRSWPSGKAALDHGATHRPSSVLRLPLCSQAADETAGRSAEGDRELYCKPSCWPAATGSPIWDGWMLTDCRATRSEIKTTRRSPPRNWPVSTRRSEATMIVRPSIMLLLCKADDLRCYSTLRRRPAL